MKPKFLLAALPLLLLLGGCASTPETQEPPQGAKAPPRKTVAKKTPPQNQQPSAPKVSPGPKTYPIENSANGIRDEGRSSGFKAEPIMPPPGSPGVPVQPAPGVPGAPGTPGAPAAPGAQGTPGVPAAGAAPQVPGAAGATPPPPPQAFSAVKLEDASMPAGTSPAVLALLTEAERDRNKGDLDASVVVMERALRLDPRNPVLTYKLAQLRLRQGKPQSAEELAGKASLLSARDLDLKRKSWLLIAEARRLQHNNAGAKEAKIKAESFFGH